MRRAAPPSPRRASPSPRPTGRVDRRHLRRVFDRIGLDPDRLGERARAQPGAAAVRPPRAAPAHADPRRRRPPASCSSTGRTMASHPADRPPAAVALADGAPIAAARWRGPCPRTSARVLDEVLAQVRDERPARPSATSRSRVAQRRARGGTGTTARLALEHLFVAGAVGATRRPSDFARLYDLTERVVPAAVLAAPTPRRARRPAGAAARWPPARSASARSTTSPTTTAQKPATCKPLVAELVEAGALVAGRGRGLAPSRPSLHPDAAVPAAGRRPGRCSARSTRWCGSATAPSGCSASTTASRSTPRRRSGSSATTCCRSCSATSSSGGST